jgi:hypothetical protein
MGYLPTYLWATYLPKGYLPTYLNIVFPTYLHRGYQNPIRGATYSHPKGLRPTKGLFGKLHRAYLAP